MSCVVIADLSLIALPLIGLFISRFDVTESSVYDAVTHTCLLLLELENEYIKWPDSWKALAEQDKIFHTKYGELLLQ